MPREFFSIFPSLQKDKDSGEYYLTDAVKILQSSGKKFMVKKINFWLGINTPDQLSSAKKILK